MQDDVSNIDKHAQKLAEVKFMFNQMEEEAEDQEEGNSMKILRMIDALQRLGLDHHFEEEIEAILKRQYNDTGPSHDLFETSLRFRLLRQQGYRTSIDVFQKFINKEGKWESKLGQDIVGLIELYEASYWATEGESTILDEAGKFCAHKLDPPPTDPLADYTLRHPLHRSLPKFHVKNYITIFHGSTKHFEDTLMDLARLDFNVNQSICQQEVVQVFEWWEELGLADGLEYARNEPIKWYMWPLAILTDPKLSEERVDLAKPISFVYLIDDIFDVYGSLDQLTLFTEIIDRWDIASADQLPNYMMKCFTSLHKVTNDIGYKVYNRHGWNPVHSLRQAWAKLFKAFLVEAMWLKGGEWPSAEEYLKNGIVSSGVQVVLVHLFFLLGQGLAQSNVDLVSGDDPPVISSVAKILRLWDDLSATNEEYDGEDGSYVYFYMLENPQSSIHEAREHVMRMIEETWKQLNHELLSPTPFPLVFNRAAHNSAKMVPLMYGCDDDDAGQDRKLPKLKDHINAMLFESIPI
ncbi:unnamed protein product [Linum tenue]|uniref:Uncharacterized protein n=1 Tax=Linum tenue TaxID=586396 RepID=A0AAV0PAI9_9ROSI|nr:unnamed protein product [Linum tenue]